MSEVKEDNYAIDVDDFDKPPLQVKTYETGSRVTRENFTNFLIKSFAVSIGNPELQYSYFRWLEEKTGFGWERTLNNFLEKGGWDCLGEDEKNKFTEAVARVEGHTKSGVDWQFKKNPNDELKYQINRLIKHQIEGGFREKYETFYQENLNTFDSKKTEIDFIRSLRPLTEKMKVNSVLF